ncbi:hypothetical protein EPA93_19415 [Ktedonosporobacter rubrisoli]|uniref:HTH luxR-type domain-containing protein n=1 Tax=Ktedonosporobacter rubrisoli TaxID=2509675 RepID=A0A4P6JRV7_KTERU|nr:LuxR C-terminal-related transcriptional regulator [Ktedonosporobacter rubrisoli]QBD78045.1 hypothetical protein EPA93_19415 [Ktedonosporobacter rubrisoli]
MPRFAKYTLTWSAELSRYELIEGKNILEPLLIQNEELWLAWLADHSSFAFEGKNGHLSVLREGREKSGKSYWYAYRRQGNRVEKRYVGRSAELSVARLEQVAASLAQQGTNVSCEPVPKVAVAQSDTSPQQNVADAMEAEQQILLAPKLHLPRLAASLVLRERLLARLDAGRMGKLTLITAPAGFGKTTLVRQWLAARTVITRVAWISLDSNDNDPIRFWNYVITACQSFGIKTKLLSSASLARAWLPPFEPPSLKEEALIPLLNELANLNEGALLVLDDYHTIDEPGVHETLAFFLEYLPITLHLVLLTRLEPPLPLARLRGNGEVCEIRADDLRFSAAETATFLQPTAVLQPEHSARLANRLEGWPTGLRLISLALQERKNPAAIEYYLATLSGGERVWIDYFVAEVLSAQSEIVQRFLLQTSILLRLTAPLCEFLTGLEESEDILETLVQANLFLERLEGPQAWYRYHQLFAEAMQEEARQRLGADTLQALFQRASQWYEQQDLLIEAVEMAFKAGDEEHMLALLARLTDTADMRQYPDIHLLRRWLEHVSLERMSDCPQLYLAYVTVMILRPGPDQLTQELLIQAEQLLQRAAEIWRERQNRLQSGITLALLAMVAQRRKHIDQAREYAIQALEWLPLDRQSERAICLTVIGISALFRDQFVLSRRMFLESRDLWIARENPHGVRGNTLLLARTCIELGELHLAAEYLQYVLAEARTYNDVNDIAETQISLAHLFYEWDELEAAEQAAQEAYELGEQLQSKEPRVQAGVMLARLHSVQGRPDAARDNLTTLLVHLSPRYEARLYSLVLLAQARCSLAEGDIAGAQRSLQQLAAYEKLPLLSPIGLEEAEQTALLTQPEKTQLSYASERYFLLTARLYLAREEAERARELLTWLLTAAEAAGHCKIAVEIRAILLLAYAACKLRRDLPQMLHTLLRQTYAEGYLRLYLDEGEPLVRVLRQLVPHIRDKALSPYLQKILRAFTDQLDLANEPVFPAALSEPLSAQEQRVLQLLAAGRTNPEIAESLIVSVNTIRKQVQSIYRKLNVTNRVEASELARTLHLL